MTSWLLDLSERELWLAILSLAGLGGALLLLGRKLVPRVSS